MNGSSVSKYARLLCDQIDNGIDRDRLKKAAVAFSIPVIILAPLGTLNCVMEYGAPFDDWEDNCSDGMDDDYDGQIDCDDPDCSTLERCMSCFDGIDNDGDGTADCSDPSCTDHEGCVGDCDDGEDNDEDGSIDCDDRDCGASEACQ